MKNYENGKVKNMESKLFKPIRYGFSIVPFLMCYRFYL